MNALVIDRIGGPEVDRITDMPIPEPGPGEVQVRVDGAGMNPVDWKIREGLFPPTTPGIALPEVTLREFSGVVTQVGPGVQIPMVGDAIYGITDRGAAAEYTVAKANEVGPRPRSLHPWDAAIVPLAGILAVALFDFGDVQAGQRVLIHAAAGGVGTYAVQLAKWAGAYVVGTCSAEHTDAVWRLGADQVVDYHKNRFEEVMAPVDMVLHSIGADQIPASLQALKPGGILVSISADPMEADAATLGKRSVRFMMQPKVDQLKSLSELIDNGTIRPVIDEVVPLERAQDAMATLEKGHTLGKLGVRMH